jgi:hypothetical protein
MKQRRKKGNKKGKNSLPDPTWSVYRIRRVRALGGRSPVKCGLYPAHSRGIIEAHGDSYWHPCALGRYIAGLSANQSKPNTVVRTLLLVARWRCSITSLRNVRHVRHFAN